MRAGRSTKRAELFNNYVIFNSTETHPNAWTGATDAACDVSQSP
jgi:hypothetical protein